MVDWSQVFATLKQVGFSGPASVHLEFMDEEHPPADLEDRVQREVETLRRFGASG
jgi:sugar phosphate isomerase/epimerase